MKRRTTLPKAQDRPSWRPMLRARAVPNTAATTQRPNDDQVRIIVPRRRPALLVPPISWIVRPKPTLAVLLDPVGTQVWRLCDGQRTVENVVDEVAQRYRLSFHEARTAVTTYIKQLVQRGALAIVMGEKEGMKEGDKKGTKARREGVGSNFEF